MDQMNPVVFFQLKDYHAKSDVAAPAEGLRRVKLTWKTAKKGSLKGIKVPSRYVDVTAAKIAIQPEVLRQALIASFESYQDGLIRKLVMEKFNLKEKKHGKLEISSDEIAVEAVANYAASTGLGRLSKEAIEAWFDSVALLPVCEAIASKKNREPTDDLVIEAAATFKALFASCANSKQKFSVKQAEALMKAADAIEASLDEEDGEDAMLEKLVAFIEPFSRPDESMLEMI